MGVVTYHVPLIHTLIPEIYELLFSVNSEYLFSPSRCSDKREKSVRIKKKISYQDKKYYCDICGNLITRFAEHLRNHMSHPLVIPIFQKPPKSVERSNLIGCFYGPSGV